MSLQKYWLKRDFDLTPEPKGKLAESKGELRFFIQLHHARSLHYDFRLEMDGTLKSWAVPKGPSLDPTDKRLAVHVEDHPLDYGTFEGSIPSGQYGAGRVVLWEEGIWVPLGNAAEGYSEGNLKFELFGHKLAGKWVLVRMGKPSDKENWLLIKEKDKEAKTGKAANITELRPESVRGIPFKKPDLTERTEKAVHSVATRMPSKISPQLATLVKKSPTGDEWLAEIKFDGYRALTRIVDGKAKIFTRNGHDWTKNWLALNNTLSKLPVDNAWLDGEVVAVKNGKIRFSALHNYDPDDPTVELRYYLFDIIYLNGQDISPLPLINRKSLLKELLSSQKDHSPLFYSEHFIGNSIQAFESACKNELEGIILKLANSTYQQSRTHNWLKLKCTQRQEFVITGYTATKGSRQGFGALLLGWYDQHGDLVYAGRVGTGFDDQVIRELGKQFQALVSNNSPYKNKLKGKELVGVHWLKPELVAEIKFAEWTSDGIVRHASFMGIRDDKVALDIIRELPENIDSKPTHPVANTSSVKKDAQSEMVEGVKITHPDRLIFTPEKITKSDLVNYYQKISEWILPHLKDRPLSLLRCPNGSEKECFFQKHLNEFDIKHIKSIKVPGHENGDYLIANKLPAVIGLVQFGVIELHTWGSTSKNLHKPDRIIFDLDPGPEVPWAKVIEGAHLVKFLLDELGLISFLKTTGGKGLHIVIPIKPEFEFPVIKALAKSIAVHLSKTVPSHFVAVMTKTKRKNKIFLDYLRNGEEATAVAAYSVRARPGAPISIPILWDELKEDLRSDLYNILNIKSRLLGLDEDPWHAYATTKQSITKEIISAFRHT
ncbi:MAG: DNA ligase D [Methylophilaceae bacterium]